MDDAPDSKDTNPRQIGPITLASLVVANMIGVGVFTSSGFSIGALGNPDRVMFAWILCGIWAICGSVAYGSLVARLPQSGGEYLFLSRFVHPSIGFLAGWISVFAGFTAPIAAAALGAAIYILPGAEDGDLTIKLIAAGLIVGATACHLAGLTVGSGAQNSIVLVKICLLAFLATWAFAFTGGDAWKGAALPERDPSWLPTGLSDWTVFVGSMSWIALSYTGFNAAIYVAGESLSARKIVPRAMFCATILVTAIYLTLNYVFVYAPESETIAFQQDVATIAAQAVGGDWLATLLRVTIVLSMSSSVFAMLLAGPRVYVKMSEDGVMPKLFSQGDSRSPAYYATIVQATLSLVALFASDLLQLMKYLGLTLSACGALAVLSLWWIHRAIPDAKKLRIWELACMLVYLAISGAIIAASYFEHYDEFKAMLWTFGLGVVVYIGWILMQPKLPDPDLDGTAESSG